jgi:hypothetical protein
MADVSHNEEGAHMATRQIPSGVATVQVEHLIDAAALLFAASEAWTPSPHLGDAAEDAARCLLASATKSEGEAGNREWDELTVEAYARAARILDDQDQAERELFERIAEYGQRRDG